mmetsp:Transcript_1998/g.2952  ORF Transcript_1998/g.2952 Transcript_1998/m.2952 type:complete len:162 (+) Transcript_1998:35-520(+)|eukprot:CAMPEP_0185725304 /NCGR_PEP_ID=MMETSP1171-20130828/1566_1 /TAXON_ID=374046 /ORGANISM="Helicotheca tamensis, Strain CCMP826" /LENGTH=161 /DNA_ID=CAMNT_0028393395 /DNA_START=62 /DNA_END=547 /DNA_ORIENTATION=-
MVKLNTVIVAASLACASAFVPSTSNARVNTELMAEKKSFFSTIFDMDLFAPDKEVNDYGARNRKGLDVGQLGAKSYIPAGMSKAEYEKIRAGDKAKKDANYAKNVAKAGKFTDYTAWYRKRGTDTNDSWVKSATKGHEMAKTKYDWSGGKDAPKYTGVEKK